MDDKCLVEASRPGAKASRLHPLDGAGSLSASRHLMPRLKAMQAPMWLNDLTTGNNPFSGLLVSRKSAHCCSGCHAGSINPGNEPAFNPACSFEQGMSRRTHSVQRTLTESLQRTGAVLSSGPQTPIPAREVPLLKTLQRAASSAGPHGSALAAYGCGAGSRVAHAGATGGSISLFPTSEGAGGCV